MRINRPRRLPWQQPRRLPGCVERRTAVRTLIGAAGLRTQRSTARVGCNREVAKVVLRGDLQSPRNSGADVPMGFSCSRRASAADCSEVEPYTDAWAAAVGRASVVASGSKAVPRPHGRSGGRCAQRKGRCAQSLCRCGGSASVLAARRLNRAHRQALLVGEMQQADKVERHLPRRDGASLSVIALAASV